METKPLKVGDRVKVTALYTPIDCAEIIGKTGVVREISHEPWPIDVQMDGDHVDDISSFAVNELEVIEIKLKPMTKAVLKMLQSSGSVSGVEAEAVHRCRDLPKRISELKQAGYTISRDMRHDASGQRYARYSLVAA